MHSAIFFFNFNIEFVLMITSDKRHENRSESKIAYMVIVAKRQSISKQLFVIQITEYVIRGVKLVE